MGRITKAIVPVFLNCYVVTLNGMTSPGDYGKLISWDDHPDAFDWMHTRKQFHPGEAVDILEAQERVMKFLIHCCEQLLHDIPPADLLREQYPIQPEPALKLGVEPSVLTRWPSWPRRRPTGRQEVSTSGALSRCLRHAPQQQRISM